jgi:hypothetical protein
MNKNIKIFFNMILSIIKNLMKQPYNYIIYVFASCKDKHPRRKFFMVNDTISDLLTRIRNANLARHDSGYFKHKMNYRISELFKRRLYYFNIFTITNRKNFNNRVKIHWKR